MIEDAWDKHDARPAPPTPDDVWKTKDGREIPIAKMGAVHLVNTILYLERHCVAWFDRPRPENMGEEAYMAALDEWLAMMEKPAFPPQYEVMLEEIERRNLGGLLEMLRAEKKKLTQFPPR